MKEDMSLPTKHHAIPEFDDFWKSTSLVCKVYQYMCLANVV